MLGKNSTQYKIWAEHAQYLNNMPYGCQVVNTGSTAGYNDFDYNLWSVPGFNLGFQPQPLYYDFETLKKYSEHIAEGAKILIGIEHFKFYLDYYEEEESDFKYYLWLDKEQIRTYNPRADWYMHHMPIVLIPKSVLHDIKRFIKKILRIDKLPQAGQYTETEDIKCSKMWANGWNNEFGWQNGQHVSEEQLKTISVVEKRLDDMIDYCTSHGWNPYIVVTPLSPNLTKLLSDEVMSRGLWEPLNRISKVKNIEIIDYYRDNRFADWHLYKDALTLNADGKRLLNAEIQKKLGITIKEERLNRVSRHDSHQNNKFVRRFQCMKVVRNVGRGCKKFLKSLAHLPAFIKQGGATYVTVEEHDDKKLLEGKNIIVTGGSSGIGFATAKKCLSNGARVLIVGRSEDKLKKAAEELGENVLYKAFDVSDFAHTSENVASAVEMLDGQVDGLVNCAGMSIWKDRFSEEDWDRILDVNVKGVYFITREIIDHMKAKQIGGSVAMISSVGDVMSQSNPYATSKAAVSHLVRGFARENMQYGIRCNGISPGETMSNIDETTASFKKDGNLYWMNNTRVFYAEEQAETIVFLLSDNASTVNGQVIVTDGGFTLASL